MALAIILLLGPVIGWVVLISTDADDIPKIWHVLGGATLGSVGAAFIARAIMANCDFLGGYFSLDCLLYSALGAVFGGIAGLLIYNAGVLKTAGGSEQNLR